MERVVIKEMSPLENRSNQVIYPQFLTFGVEVCLCSSLDIHSMHRPNKYREIGSPYLSPLAPLKCSYMPSLIANQNVVVVIHFLIHVVKDEGKSKPCSIFSKKS